MEGIEAGERQHDVLIIGGGVAGLSAARELLENGCSNICVVEAQDRLGGRVKQVLCAPLGPRQSVYALDAMR